MNLHESNCIVLLVSRVTSVRKRWKHELEDSFLIYEASSVRNVFHLASRRRPSILLLDMELPDFNPHRDIRFLLRLSPSTKILAFVETQTEKEAAVLLKAGIKGYASINLDVVLLKKAIHMVQKGEVWIDRKFISYVLNDVFAPRHGKLLLSHRMEMNKLTLRERQIAMSIAEGATNKEIAVELGITEATVKSHVTNIFLKLGLSDRLSLALYVRGRELKGK